MPPVDSEYFSPYTEVRESALRTRIYTVHEPLLSPFETELLVRIRTHLRENQNPQSPYTKETLAAACDTALRDIRIPVSDATRKKILYRLDADILGWGKLELLRHDPDIEDISCVGWQYPLYLYHRKYRDIETDICFSSEEELIRTISLFAQKAGKQISLQNPVVDGTLEDGSRIQLTFGSTLSSRGPGFTIRKFRSTPYSVIDLLQNRTFTIEEMVYLWFAIEYNRSILIIGGTASGKTTTLNALSQFIPPLSKIVTLEDTGELMLCHGNWYPAVVPPAGGRETLSLFDLVAAAMRQRPEYLIVGEVRGKETSAMFQAINTGHTSFSTFHAGDFQSAVNRLENPPLNIPRAMIATLDIVLSQQRIVQNGVQMRRCREIAEIHMQTDGQLCAKPVFTYQRETDDAKSSVDSRLHAEIPLLAGIDAEAFNREWDCRCLLLTSLLCQNITDFQDVSAVLDAYMTDCTAVLSSIDSLRDICGV